jgi:dipeptidyl aminopeptidase/acylaminoacyl peptidase
MSLRSLARAVFFTSFLSITVVGMAHAQALRTANGGSSGNDDPKRPVTPADYGKFESLGRSVLSPHGLWLAVEIRRVNEENELRIRRTDRDSVVVLPYGIGARFTNNARWLAYQITVSQKEQEALEKQSKPVQMRLGIMNIATGDTTSVEAVSSFQFSHDGEYIAMGRYPPQGDRDSQGNDLVVRTLDSGEDMNFGNVSQYAWQDEGNLLALVIDAEGEAGNGLQVFEPAEGTLRSLESKRARFTTLTWRDESDDLAVLRIVADSGYEDSTHAVIAWRDLENRNPRRFEFDPAEFDGFPEDTRIVDYRGLRWSEDGRTVFFGIKDHRKKVVEEQADSTETEGEAEEGEEEEPDEEEKKSEEDEEPATVEVWNAKDVDIIPEQKVFAGRDRTENYLSAWHLDDSRFVQLGNELTETSTLVDGEKFAIGMNQTPYERERMFGPRYNDVYRIDVASGDREMLHERVEINYGPSKSGRYYLYFEDDNFWTIDLESGEPTNITESVPTSFVNADRGLTVEQKPPWGMGGWTENDRSVFLYDRYDIWEVRADGSEASRLTRGAEDSVRYRYARLDFDEEFIDTDEPLYLTTYGDWTKKSGYARVRRGQPPEQLVWMDAAVSTVRKADSADTYTFMAQRFDDSPDYFVAGPTLASPRQVTETNPFLADYAWAESGLIEYENAWGVPLQAILRYPADYEPGKQYPMIVYIYERLSRGLHSFYVPSERSPYNDAVFTAEGYFVLRPDIVYRDRDPGVSAVAAIEPAVQAAIATGLVDPDRVGLTGHSWGGYQTAFTVTQTDIFSAAVAGAPLTNLFSMYLSVYWNSGGTDARIFEISQGRMEVPFWEDIEAYRRNSPVFHVDKLNTPLLVAHGTEDGAVDFNQGVEYYNAARRANKDFVLLVYNGENHGNRQKPNQLDYHRRIIQWFGHYLKGDPAPQWISEGVSYLEQERAKEEKKTNGR